MVRHKTRWLLVHAQVGKTVPEDTRGHNRRRRDQKQRGGDVDSNDANIQHLTKNDFYNCIQENLLCSFGVAASDVALDFQIRFYDSAAGLLLIRVARPFCQVLRASLTLLNQISVTVNNSTSQRWICFTVRSVNGSARTAKVATMAQIHQFYRKLLLLQHKSDSNSQTTKSMDRICNIMNKSLSSIQNVE